MSFRARRNRRRRQHFAPVEQLESRVLLTTGFLDLDRDGESQPLSDGILVLRQMAGFSDSVLTNGVIGTNALRVKPAEIIEFAAANEAAFDADGNGKREPLSDGILILRALAGFDGATLTDGVIGDGATRTEPDAIIAHVNSHLAGLGLGHVSPDDGDEMVNVTREIIVRFDGRVVPDTVTDKAITVTAGGEAIPGRLRVSPTGRFATFFPDDPLPAASGIRVTVDGEWMRNAHGISLDADGDGAPGGSRRFDFTTLPLTRIAGTKVFGFVRDSLTGDPIEGATIRVDAFPSANATTDNSGRFELIDMPAPEFFVHIDGSTAMNAPDGATYPNVGKPFHSVPGATVQVAAHGTTFDIFLPPMGRDDVQSLSTTETTSIGFGTRGKADLATILPGVDSSIWDATSISIAPGSAIDDRGNATNTAAIIPVSPNRLPAPLPAGFDPQLVISVQAGGATNFDVPAPITFPNLDGLAPGETSLLFSFDHDAGAWGVVGSGTVSDDGTMIVSDPGSGIVAPGWHFTQPGFEEHGFITDIVVDPGVEPEPNPNPQTDGVKFEAGLLLDGNFVPLTVTGKFGVEVPLTDTATQPFLWEPELKIPELGIDFDLSPSFTFTVSEFVSQFVPEFDIPLFEIEGRAGVVGQATSQVQIKGNGFSTIGSLSGEVGANVALNFEFTIGKSPLCHLPFGVGNFICSTHDKDIPLIGPPLFKFEDVPITFNDAIPFDFDLPFGPVAEIFAGVSGNVVPRVFIRRVDNVQPSTTVIDDRSGLSQHSGFTADSNVHYRFVLDNGFEIQGVTNESGHYWETLPAETQYTLYVYSPKTNSTAVYSGTTGASGDDATREIQLEQSGGPDFDNDQIPDFGEFVLGTDSTKPDTDGDGILDSVALSLGLNPAGGAALGNGVIASVPLPGEAREVVVAGIDAALATQYAFVASGAEGLTTVDVSEPGLPIETGRLKLTGVAVDVAVSGTQAVVAAEDGGLHFVDVSDPMLPMLQWTIADETAQVEIVDDLVFAASGTDVVAYDLYSGQPLERLTVGDRTITGLAHEGSYLYTMDDRRNLRVIDLSRTGHNGHFYAAIDTPGTWQAARDAATQLGGHLVSITSAAEQEFITRSFLSGTGASTPWWMGLTDEASEGDFVWITGEPLDFTFWNSGEPNNSAGGRDENYGSINWHVPSNRGGQIGDWNDLPNDGSLGGTSTPQLLPAIIEFEALPTGFAGMLHAWDRSRLMSLRDSLEVPQGGGQLFVSNGVAYVAASESYFRGGFGTVNVSNPDELVLISGSDIESPNVGPGTDVAPNGSGLGIVVGSNGGVDSLDVVDLSDLTATNEFLTRFELPQDPYAVTLASGLAFVADGRSGLQIVNYLPLDTAGQAPTVTITSDTPDSSSDDGHQIVEGSRVHVSVAAIDDVQIRDVQLVVDGTVVATDVSAPFDFFFSVPTISNTASEFTVQVRGTDTGGNVGESNTLTFELVPDTIAPFIEFTAPEESGFLLGGDPVVLIASEAIAPSSIDTSRFELLFLGADGQPGGGDDVSAAIDAVTPAGNKRLLLNASGLTTSGTWQLTVAAGAFTDRAANPLADVVQFEFDVFDLTGDWILRGLEFGRTTWFADVSIQSNVNGRGFTGHFDWQREGFGSHGRELFDGSVDPSTGLVTFRGHTLENSSGIGLTAYGATLTAGGQILMNGFWGSSASREWTASRVTAIETDFEADADGWLLEGDATIAHTPEGGEPNSYLAVTDDTDTAGDKVRLVAPSKFHGNWTWNGRAPGALSFALQQLDSDGSRLSGPAIDISGPGGAARIELQTSSGPSTSRWQTYVIPLDESLWTVSSGDWASLLSNVTRLTLDAEFIDGSEVVGVDTIRLLLPHVPTGQRAIVADDERRLFTVDTVNGQVNLIGTTEVELYDIAADASGKLFGIDSTGRLYSIDASTAATTLIGATGEAINGLEFSPDGTLYAAGSRLWIIDTATAAATLVGDLGSFDSQGDLAFAPDGTLYIAAINGRIAVINPATAEGRLLVDHGNREILGLAFGPDGILYAFTQADHQIYAVDRLTGDLELLNEFQQQAVSGANGATFSSVFPPIARASIVRSSRATAPMDAILIDELFANCDCPIDSL